jgi:hypothetical protein
MDERMVERLIGEGRGIPTSQVRCRLSQTLQCLIILPHAAVQPLPPCHRRRTMLFLARATTSRTSKHDQTEYPTFTLAHARCRLRLEDRSAHDPAATAALPPNQSWQFGMRSECRRSITESRARTKRRNVPRVIQRVKNNSNAKCHCRPEGFVVPPCWLLLHVPTRGQWQISCTDGPSQRMEPCRVPARWPIHQAVGTRLWALTKPKQAE